MELWKDIVGYEGLYQVSNFGRIRSLDRIIKRPKMGDFFKKSQIIKNKIYKGYFSVQLSKQGITKNHKVHRLVAQAFIPNPNNYKEVNHKDENKENNCADNLEWCTHKYNMEYGTWVNRREKKINRSYCSKKILQYDLEKKYIKTWDSISMAQRELNINHISSCCSGKRKTAGGYIWEYC